MTMPDQPTQIAQAYQTSATPQGFADRVQQLNDNGHDWMPHDMQTALASSQTSDNGMLSIADNIKQTLQHTWDGFTEAFDDPVLHKQPTAALAAARYVTAAIGPLPVEQPSLSKIQKNLQQAGFGKGLDASGEWTPDWNAEYNSYLDAHNARQLAGDKPGSVSTGKAAGHWYDVFNPIHDVNAIAGYVKALPGAVRDVVADVVGQAVNVADPAEWGSPSKAQEEASPGAAAARAVQSFLGNSQARQRVSEQIAHPNASLLGDIQTVLSIAPVLRTGSAAMTAARGTWASGVDTAAAQRTTGVIASSMFGGLRRNVIGMAPDADALVAAQRGILDATGRNELRAGPLNALSTSRVFRNIPLLRQVGPAVGRLADADGLYYRARTLLATPYQYGQARAVGQLGQTTFLTGAAMRGAAQAENALGLSNPQSRSIVNTDALNTVDLNLNRVLHTPFAHPASDAVDALGYVLHGPLGNTGIPNAIGDKVQAGTDAFSHFLSTIDVRGAWEMATRQATGKTVTIQDLEKSFGSPEHLDRFMQMKLADLGANHYAQHQAQLPVDAGGRGLEYGTPEYRDATGELATEAWNNPDLHMNAIKELVLDPYELANRISEDMVHNSLDPKAYASNGINWMHAGSIMANDIIKAGLAKHIIGPDGRALIRSAQDNLDFGAGMDNPVRLSATTRRDYVHQVSTTLARVQRQVNDTRTKAGKIVADLEATVGRPEAEARYEQAATTEGPQVPGETAARVDEQGRTVRPAVLPRELRDARNQQAALEAALESGDMRQFARVAKQIIPPTAKTKGQLDRLVKDTKRLRQLVDQAGNPDERLTLQHLVDNGVNPDELYTRINGEPRVSSEPIGSGDWMREHLQTPNGAIGLGHLDTKSAQEAAADVSRFQTRLDAAKTQEETDQIVEDMRNYAFNEFGINDRTIGINSPQGIVSLLDRHAHNLASDWIPSWDAPQKLHDKIAQINELGYKPMIGSHIGHAWDHSLPPMPELGAAISRRRKVAGALGLNPDQISPRAAGQDARIRVLRETSKVPEQGGVFPARHTAESVLSVLTDKNLLVPDMKKPEQVAYATAKALGFHTAGIKQLAKERGIVDMKQAALEYESEIARGLQVRDIPRGEFLRALMTPGTGKTSTGRDWEWPGVDKPTANLIYRAVQRGYADRPGYMMGASAIEDWARGGFTFLDKGAVKYADNEFWQRAAALPNELVIARNRLRFTLSPFFDWRRVIKQNYKMSQDDVNPVGDPLKHMVNNGTFEQAHKYLTRVIGEPQVTGFDDADRYLHQQSVWGMYNSRHFEAYYAWEKKQQGWTDSQIQEGIHRVFDYGSARKGGARSPLERTMNTIFFPFSFEKTLLRNTGAYMLNHPQQALLLTGAMTAYNEANQNEQIHRWTQDHLPVLRDLQKLNGFAHGISPGELGGINAPLLNLFLPQMWGKEFSKKNLQRNFPIWNDFHQLYADVRDQAKIARDGLLNVTDAALGHLGLTGVAGTVDQAVGGGHVRGLNSFDPYRPLVTDQAQKRLAARKRNQFIVSLQPVLEYNAGVSADEDKATFPRDDTRLPDSVRGHVVNRSTIGNLVKAWFPAYDPAGATAFAIQQADKAQAYIDALPDTTKKQQQTKQDYGVFLKLADSLRGKLQRGDYDTAEGAQVMAQFRNAATAASETDPSFYKFYNTHFRYLLGPLEEVTR